MAGMNGRNERAGSQIRMRVLVVDRERDVREVIEDLLLDHGFEVHHASSRPEAIGALRDRRFEALLCHLSLLREEGGQLAYASRHLQPGLRVIAMSASAELAAPGEADANLLKPFTRRQLLEVFKQTPEQAGPAPENRAPLGPS